ncbi:MAG: FAD-dependent oxidoreductase, partial [Gammaproteobacteria bacterium]|nr:FAD-dependent oxidoreductase [Gammaproteobacteria bacterium]
SGQDIRGWLDIVRGIEKPPETMGMQEYAFRRSTNANPFPSMMGRVCPAPCEQGCNRNQVEEFVGINAVEQYIGDSAKSSGFSFDNSAALSGKKIAIIGGGPAGLTAAYQLRRKGHASVIFDDHEELGGMFKYGIPGYRTPREFLNHEIQRILDMGDIEVKLSTRVGRDISMESLDNNFDAVIWAVGCKTGRPIPVKNADAPNCVSGVDFLEAFNKGDMQVTAERVVCVGGGDTSIDVVSVARRLGAVATLTSLFGINEMTASEHEVNDALREGVDIHDAVMPLEVILGENGQATGLKMCRCNMVDNRPEPINGTEYVIDCDLIVAAIGQTGDLAGLESLDNGKGLVDADALFRVPGREGHFVAGDIVRPHLLTTAIGQASICADSIDRYLNGETLRKRPKVDVQHFDLLNKLRESALEPVEFTNADDGRGTDSANYAIHNYENRSDKEIISSERLFLSHFEYTERVRRADNVPDAEHVKGHFEDRIVALSEEQAIAEASRCMSCGMCFECDNCVIYCPQDAVFRV